MKKINCITFVGENREINLVKFEMKNKKQRSIVKSKFLDLCCNVLCDDFDTLMEGESLTLCNLKGSGKFAY